MVHNVNTAQVILSAFRYVDELVVMLQDKTEKEEKYLQKNAVVLSLPPLTVGTKPTPPFWGRLHVELPTHLNCVHCKQLAHATDLFSSSSMHSVHVTQYHTGSLLTSFMTDWTMAHAAAEKYFLRPNSDTLSSVAADVPVLRITLSDEMGVALLMLHSAVSASTNQDSITADRPIHHYEMQYMLVYILSAFLILKKHSVKLCKFYTILSIILFSVSQSFKTTVVTVVIKISRLLKKQLVISTT